MRIDDSNLVFSKNSPQDRFHRPKWMVTLLKDLESQLRRPMRLLEAGTIRALTEGHRELDGHSTYHLAKFAHAGGHSLIGVDLSTDVCHEALRQYALREKIDLSLVVLLIDGDALEHFKTLPDQSIDFVYLDAATDAVYTKSLFDETMRIIRPEGLICMDDCHHITDTDPMKTKGGIVRPYLQKLGIKLRFVGLKILVLDPQEILDARGLA